MKKLSVVLLIIALGISGFMFTTPKTTGSSIAATFNGDHLAYDVGPGPDVISNKIAMDVGPKPDVSMINAVAHEERSQPTNLFAVDTGPEPSIISNKATNLLAAVVGPGSTLIEKNIG